MIPTDRRVVQVALRRPYTFIVLALLLLILGVLTISRTAKDIWAGWLRNCLRRRCDSRHSLDFKWT
jgi:hypothetical protein